jgi:hypothetical protein
MEGNKDMKDLRGLILHFKRAISISKIIGLWKFICAFFYLVCEVIGIAAIPGLLCQPRVIVKMIVEKQMECRLAGETEVLWENLPQCHVCICAFSEKYRIITKYQFCFEWNLKKYK